MKSGAKFLCPCLSSENNYENFYREPTLQVIHPVLSCRSEGEGPAAAARGMSHGGPRGGGLLENTACYPGGMGKTPKSLGEGRGKCAVEIATHLYCPVRQDDPDLSAGKRSTMRGNRREFKDRKSSQKCVWFILQNF